MLRLAEVLLRRLNLGDDRRLVQRAEQWVERFARHEVDRAVLDLDEDVWPELSIELRELDVGALGAIRIHVFVVDERAPDDVAAVTGDRIGKAVGALGVIAAVVLGSRLPFGIRLDEKPAEVGNELVDLVGLAFHQPTTPGSSGSAVFRPPRRIGAAKFADSTCGDRPAPEIGERGHFGQVTGVRTSTLALTLLMTVPLMPIEALRARSRRNAG